MAEEKNTKNTLSWLSFPSAIGFLTICATDNALCKLQWGKSPKPNNESHKILQPTQKQITAYLENKLKTFDLPIQFSGTAFQTHVYQALLEIPYGQHCTYSDLAGKLSSAPRAIGSACGKNPIPIIIPCHRVVGKNGTLTGYSGGAGNTTKRHLLDLEQKYI
ncbi:MAG: hypothetical protein CBB68_08335 [Rhodospirillaceae bacterium TMED8]|nr:MAG: hypothetical protein CBB68_08335 [Rhodospirillaceae bacterium TMED8]